MLGSVLVAALGLGRLVRAAAMAARWCARAPGGGRAALVVLVAGAAVIVAMLPYGLWFVAAGLAGGAGRLWRAWGTSWEELDPWRLDAEAAGRLRAIYEGLVPCFSLAGDASPHAPYAPGGSWDRCFVSFSFGQDGRLDRLRLVYPPHVPDGDAQWRRRVEGLLVVRAGGDREYGFRWDGERSELEMAALEPLPAGTWVRRFVTAPRETVLGFTDEGAVDRALPVCGWAGAGEMPVDAPAVVWGTGPRSAEPHLLVAGAPGAGATTLLRVVALQALRHGGEVLLVDGSGAGEYACFAGRVGVVGVESAPGGAVAALEWAAWETERRVLAAGRQGAGCSDQRPLWIVVDRPVLLAHLARAEGVRDPLKLLEVPLRRGRAGRVTVVLAEWWEELEGLGDAALGCTRARVVLGALPPEWVGEVLGALPGSWPLADAPPGRGYVRLGAGPVLRLQVPSAPDPWDEEAGEAERRAVLGLLPGAAAGGVGTAGG